MSLSVVYTRANIGIDAPLVTIEVHLSNGLPGFQLVGLPETTVKESRDRVRSALINAGFEFPSKKIVVNMAPADLPKGGARFDLAIAIGIIAAHEKLDVTALEQYEFVGELALSGELRSIHGALPMACAVAKSGRTLILPQANANEGALVSNACVLSAKQLFDVYLHLTGKKISRILLISNTPSVHLKLAPVAATTCYFLALPAPVKACWQAAYCLSCQT